MLTKVLADQYNAGFAKGFGKDYNEPTGEGTTILEINSFRAGYSDYKDLHILDLWKRVEDSVLQTFPNSDPEF